MSRFGSKRTYCDVCGQVDHEKHFTNWLVLNRYLKLCIIKKEKDPKYKYKKLKAYMKKYHSSVGRVLFQ